MPNWEFPLSWCRGDRPRVPKRPLLRVHLGHEACIITSNPQHSGEHAGENDHNHCQCDPSLHRFILLYLFPFPLCYILDASGIGSRLPNQITDTSVSALLLLLLLGYTRQDPVSRAYSNRIELFPAIDERQIKGWLACIIKECASAVRIHCVDA